MISVPNNVYCTELYIRINHTSCTGDCVYYEKNECDVRFEICVVLCHSHSSWLHPCLMKKMKVLFTS